MPLDFSNKPPIANQAPDTWPGYGVQLVDDLPNPVPAEQLREAGMFETIQKLVAETVRADYSPDAQELLKRLNLLHLLQTSDPELYQTYEKFVNLLKFVSLHGRKENELPALFEKHFLPALEAGVDIKAKLSLLFLIYDEIVGEGALAQRILNYLSRNEETLGRSPLQIVGETYSVRPVIGNWLVDYNQFINRNRKPGTLFARSGGVERAAYITQSQNVKHLSSEERRILLLLIELYDWLRFGSAPSLPEPAAPTYIRRERIAVPLPPRPQATPEPKNIRTQAPKPAPRVLPPPPRPPLRQDFEGQAPAPKAPAIRPEPRAPVFPQAPPISPVRPPPPVTPLPMAKPEPRPELIKPPTQSPKEDLYRSTLEELQKMREQEAKLAAARGAQAAKNQPPVSAPTPATRGAVVSPREPLKASPTTEPFSVNEAIIHAGGHEIPLTGAPSNAGPEGQVVAGEEQDLDKKLKDLEGKLE